MKIYTLRKRLLHFTALSVLLSSWCGAAPAVHERTWKLALPRAQQGGKCIAVLVRGSNWCPAGEFLFENQWQLAEFTEHLGDDFILTSVDYCDWNSLKHTKQQMQKKLLSENKGLKDRIVIVPNQVRTKIARGSSIGSDGIINIVNGEPGTEVITINFNALNIPATAFYVEFLDDPLSDERDKICLNEADLVYDGKSVPFCSQATYSFACGGNIWDPVKASDANEKSAWVFGGNNRNEGVVFIPFEAVPAGKSFELNLSFLDAKYITPERIRVSILDNEASHQYVTECIEIHKMFEWRAESRAGCPASTQHYPAIHVYRIDSHGKHTHLGGMHGIRTDETALDLAKKIKGYKDRKDDIDAKTAALDRYKGEEKAEKIGELLGLTGYYKPHWTGRRKSRRHRVHHLENRYQELLKLDPQDRSGYIRRYNFNSGEVLKDFSQLKDSDYKAAVALFERAEKDYRNRRLAKEAFQDMYWKMYNQVTTREDKIFALQKVVECNPNNTLGVGAEGLLLKNFKVGPPTFRWGWRTDHVHKGRGTIVYNCHEGVDLNVQYAGWNKFTVIPSGKSDFVVHAVRLVINGQAAAEEVRDGRVGGNLNYFLNLPKWTRGDKREVHIEYTAAEDGKVSGKMNVTPYFAWELPEEYREE